jgi:hypothetical protein
VNIGISTLDFKNNIMHNPFRRKKPSNPKVNSFVASSDPDVRDGHSVPWSEYSDKAQRDLLLSRFIYETDDTKKDAKRMEKIRKEFQEHSKTINENDCEIVFYTDKLADTNGSEYRAVVLINHKTKEVIVANAGTRCELNRRGLHDVWNDVYLITQNLYFFTPAAPPKLKKAHVMNTIILDNLGDKASQYKFHYTGHSLGAAMSDIAATDMCIQMKQRNIAISTDDNKAKISTFTFDNPGTFKLIKHMYKINGLDPEEHIDKVEYMGINNKHNTINMAMEQTKNMWIMEPQDKTNNPLQNFIYYISFKVKIPYISRMVRFLSFGLISSLRGHKLDNFYKELFENGAANVRIYQEERIQPLCNYSRPLIGL